MMNASHEASEPANEKAPHVGSPNMPAWDVGELIEAPTFRARNWFALLGPGLVMGAAAIGGGEWLMGPLVTAKYGGGLFWLVTISIFAQALYNVEISRYTLYTGEPIFTGKFRTPPGPMFWIGVYLLLDFGSIFPYLAANAATPVATVLLGGQVPDPEHVAHHWWLMKILSVAIFTLSIIPLLVGGKIYNSIKLLMSVKLVLVLGFLLLLAILYSRAETWWEISSGFVKFGHMPVLSDEDRNGNGVLDDGEDWDGDGHLDVVEPQLQPSVDSNQDGIADAYETGADGRPIKFVDIDGDGYHDGENVENVFVSLFTRGRLPDIDFRLIALIAALAAIAGNGGLTNVAISNYTRDQGWGMGWHVGAIPSIIGGHGIQLSHVGRVFQVTAKSLERWRHWYRHVLRDQMVVWVPACFIGIALPSMLSVEFLRRGTDAGDWNAAVMTASGVQQRVANPPPDVLASITGLSQWVSGDAWGRVFWALCLLCGFLVLGLAMAATMDGILRRWVDAFWTASARLRKVNPKFIGRVYFRVLLCYGAFGVLMLWLNTPTHLIKLATLGYNFALGFSCIHTLYINTRLLPRELRPHWFVRCGLVGGGLFFVMLGLAASYQTLKDFGWL